MEEGKRSDENDERQIDSPHFCKAAKNHGPVGIPFFLLFWSIMLLVDQSPPLLSVAAMPSVSVADPVHRRCIGQFFDSHITKNDKDDNGQNKRNWDGSVLHWLNENTSCDLASEPFVSSNLSWKRKKKDPNNNNDGSRSADGSTAANFDDNNRPYHAVILMLENDPIHHEIVAIASGLLVAGLEVTIFYIFQDNETLESHRKNQMTADSIKSEILQRLPFEDNFIQYDRDYFQFVKLNLNEYIEKAESKNVTDDYTSHPNELNSCKNEIAAAHPLDRCAIEIAPAVLRLLLENVDANVIQKMRGKAESNNDGTHKLDFVMMMDASLLGGLLFSEIKMIPTVAIGSHQTLMFAIEQEPKWNPSQKRMTLDRMDRIFLQRLYSLGLTGAFLRANQMRHSLGFQELKRLKSPLDCFLPVVAMLVDLIPSDITLPLSPSISSLEEVPLNTELSSDDESGELNGNDYFHLGGEGYGYRVHNIQPLLSPCTLCSDQLTRGKIEDNSAVIMVAPGVGVSAKWTRSLIRALSLTKQSLEGYDDCLFDRASCRNGVVDFQVDWLAMRDEWDNHFPPVVPSFIHRETSVNLLDSAILNPNTIIALIHCNSESNILVALGIEVFCISQSDRIPMVYSVGDLLHDKVYRGDATDIDFANDRDSPSRLLQESLARENVNPEEVAAHLLRILRRKSIQTERSISTKQKDTVEKRNKEVASWVASGLQRTVTIVQAAARVHRENTWKNPRQMQAATSKAITKALNSMDGTLQCEISQQVIEDNRDAGGKHEMYHVCTVSVAWLVCVSAAIYIKFKDSTVMKRWRQYRYHRFYTIRGSVLDNILSRSNELDDAWDILSSWSSDLPFFDPHDRRIGRSRSREHPGSNVRKEHQLQSNNNNHNNQHSQMRRRRKMKTAR
jgi:hypothetical protein